MYFMEFIKYIFYFENNFYFTKINKYLTLKRKNVHFKHCKYKIRSKKCKIIILYF